MGGHSFAQEAKLKAKLFQLSFSFLNIPQLSEDMETWSYRALSQSHHNLSAYWLGRVNEFLGHNPDWSVSILCASCFWSFLLALLQPALGLWRNISGTSALRIISLTLGYFVMLVHFVSFAGVFIWWLNESCGPRAEKTKRRRSKYHVKKEWRSGKNVGHQWVRLDEQSFHIKATGLTQREHRKMF